MGEKVLRTYVADEKRNIQTLDCYRLNRIFMRMIGQWPFSPLWQQRLAAFIFLCGMASLYILEVIKFIESRNDLNMVLEFFTPVMINTASFIKMLTLFFGAKAIRELFTRMQNDWNIRTEEGEKRILEEYANKSRFLTKAYAVYMYCLFITYHLMASMPLLLNFIKPLNESRPTELPSHAEYFIEDPLEYYFPLLIHQFTGSITLISTVVVCDTMYATYVQHACGVFATLKYKLENLVGDEGCDDGSNESRDDKRVFDKLATCIIEHQKAIKFAYFIESTYCMSNLMQMMINMVVISVTGFVVSDMQFYFTPEYHDSMAKIRRESFKIRGEEAVTNLDKIDVVVRFGAFMFAELMHLLFNSLPGQAIHDHSAMIFYAAYNSKWYLISNKSRSLLKLMMVRSMTPCQLTAGKLYVMDLERFGAVLQTSLSYFTVLTSVR